MEWGSNRHMVSRKLPLGSISICSLACNPALHTNSLFQTIQECIAHHIDLQTRAENRDELGEHHSHLDRLGCFHREIGYRDGLPIVLPRRRRYPKSYWRWWWRDTSWGRYVSNPGWTSGGLRPHWWVPNHTLCVPQNTVFTQRDLHLLCEPCILPLVILEFS